MLLPQQIQHGHRAGGIKQHFRRLASLGSRHGQEVVIRAKGRFAFHCCEPPVRVMGVADPGVVTFVVQVWQHHAAASGRQQAAQGD